MTGYTVNTGTSKKFAAGWDTIFGTKKSAKKTAEGNKGEKTPQSKSKKKSARKKSAKKKSR